MDYETRIIFFVPAVVLLLGTMAAFTGCDESAVQEMPVLSNQPVAKQTLLYEDKKNALYELSNSDGKVGYVVDSEVVSRSGPFQILVTLSNDYVVTEAKVTSYPAQRGRQVKFPSFTDQFKGKGAGDAIRVGRDIHAISVATISSRVMAKGVKNSIRLARRHSDDQQD